MRKLFFALILFLLPRRPLRSFLTLLIKNAFDERDFPRVGLEVEMSGMTTKDIALVVQGKLGGQFVIANNEYSFPEYHLKIPRSVELSLNPKTIAAVALRISKKIMPRLASLKLSQNRFTILKLENFKRR